MTRVRRTKGRWVIVRATETRAGWSVKVGASRGGLEFRGA